jgi:hypothetical protein
LNSSTYTSFNILKCDITIIERCHRFAILGKRLKFGERSRFPIHRSQDYWDNQSVASVVSLKCCLHLYVNAVVGRKKIRTDQKENNIRTLDMLIDLIRPVAAGVNPMIVPAAQNALSLNSLKCFARRSRSFSSLCE